MFDEPRWQFSPLLNSLKERYPYQFSKPTEDDVQRNILAGWLPVFERLCAEVDALLAGQPRGFYWLTLKEKFGTARWRPCFSLKLDAATKDKLYELVYAAQARTESICGICGVAVTAPYQSPDVQLCPTHFELFRQSPDWLQFLGQADH